MSETTLSEIQYQPALRAATQYQSLLGEAWLELQRKGWDTYKELAWALTMAHPRVLVKASMVP
eukprot:gene7555-705_t